MTHLVLDCRDGKGVPEDMRRDRAADAGAVGNALQHALDGAGTEAEGFV